MGRQLLRDRPHAWEGVQASLQGLSSKWEGLKHKLAEHGERLQRARQLLELLQVSRREGQGTGGSRRLCQAGWGTGEGMEGRGREESGIFSQLWSGPGKSCSLQRPLAYGKWSLALPISNCLLCARGVVSTTGIPVEEEA